MTFTVIYKMPILAVLAMVIIWWDPNLSTLTLSRHDT
jgi:hypothetical protein